MVHGWPVLRCQLLNMLSSRMELEVILKSHPFEARVLAVIYDYLTPPPGGGRVRSEMNEQNHMGTWSCAHTSSSIPGLSSLSSQSPVTSLLNFQI